MQRALRFLFICLAVLILALAAAAGLWLTNDASISQEADTSTEAAPPPTVRTVTVARQESYEQNRVYSGLIEASRRADLAFAAPGVVERVLVEAGDEVESGELIAELESGGTSGRLVSPINGLVASIRLAEGSSITPGSPVARVFRPDSLLVRIGVPPEEAERMAAGDTVEVEVDGESHRSTLTSIQLEIDPRTRTRSVTLSFDEETSRALTPGALARLPLKHEIASSGFWVPLSALTREVRGLWSVFALETDGEGVSRIVQRYVEVLHFDGRRAWVQGDLADGESIVAEGTFRVVPGQQVLPESGESAPS